MVAAEVDGLLAEGIGVEGSVDIDEVEVLQKEDVAADAKAVGIAD